MPDIALVRLLDELGLNATAATTMQLVEGWVLRAAPEYPFRRCNSAFTTDGRGALTAARLALVAGFYGSRGLPVRYQISPAAQPAGLDEHLAEAGYEVEAPVDILVAGIDLVIEHTTARSHHLAVDDRFSDAWARTYGALHGDDDVPGTRIAAYGRLMRTLGPPAVVVTVDDDGSPAGVGFGVVERGWLGVFGMGTRPDARRRGIATAVLHGLARAAREHGAARAYLQVETDNTGATALYERASFTRAYGYHYRVRA